MRKTVPMAVAGGVLVASLGTFGVNQALAKDVQLVVDGVPTQVKTTSGTVGDVLQSKRISLGERDIVAPAAAEKVADGQLITVRYARPLKLTLDGAPKDLWTTAITVDEALNEIALREESKVSSSRSEPIGRQGIELSVESAKQFMLVSGGESKQVISTGRTVNDALTESGVSTDGDDEVVPAKDATLAEGTTVTVSKHDFKETPKAIETPYKTVRKDSAELPRGEEKVDVKGVTGKIVEVWTEHFVDGKSVENKVTSRRVENEPKDELILVGTGSKASSSSATKSQSSGASGSSGSAGSSGSGTAAGGAPAVGASCQASMYDEPQMTATGEVFNPSAMTAAHKTLPLGSRVKVTNPRNGKTVTVRINDRGPYIAGRCLDLSRASFAAIGDVGAGVMTVVYQPL